MMKTVTKLVALAAVLLLSTALPAWASQGVGGSPYTADLLISGLNTGQLNPGQEYWYAYSRIDLGDPGYNSVILSLNFEAEGRSIASRVNFQVFNFSQVEAWLKDNSGPVDSLGLGIPASADFDVTTGERFWAGSVAPNDIYYVRVFNISPSPVQYRLTALGQKSAGLEPLAASAAAFEPQVIPAAISVHNPAAPGKAAAPVSVAPPVSAQPSVIDTLPIQPDDSSPVSTGWLLAAQAINGLPPAEAAAWLMSAASLGWLPVGSPALAPINPDAQVAGVTTPGGDSGNASGVVVTTPPDPSQGYSIYPNQPIKLLQGPNIGRLAPKTEHWYTFTAGKVDDIRFEDMSLTIFFTPGEPNLASNVIFEMFTAGQYHIWERGTPNDMEHFGVGSWVSRDGDYNTGERLWRGMVIDGDQYFVKLTNGSNEWIDYYLIPGDIINIEMGPKTETKPQPVALTPTGHDIGSPLPLSLGHTRATLAAGEDIWFQFEYNLADPDEFEFHPYLIELNHTPGAGHITNHVNFEIYPFQEQHLWRRGDTDKITPLGVGSDLKYDKASDTHTWVWDGHLVSNTIYFIRLRNDSPHPIDYDFFIKRK
ncbi:MAG: hypothetical protein JW953_03810 [Anaerolineae bacterium]|nr:hypothetical protein [Anaerolineae bacterium]